jgi:hypothetical protein
MPAQPEVLRAGTRSGKESLGVTRGLASLHAPHALPGGLVGFLCAVIKIPVLVVFHSQKQLSIGGSV